MKSPMARAGVVLAAVLAIAGIVLAVRILPGTALISGAAGLPLVAAAIVFAVVFLKYTEVFIAWLAGRMSLNRQVGDLNRRVRRLRDLGRLLEI